MAITQRKSRPLYRLLLLSATISVVLPLMQGMATGAIQGATRALLIASLLTVGFLGFRLMQQRVAQRASVRRVNELLRFFDDMSLLRARAQAARALLAGEPANEVERKALVAVSQCLAELARAVAESTAEGRSSVLAHPIVGAWLRALAVTPQALSYDEAQRAALKTLFVDVGAPSNRREPLDEGSRALLERDAVLFRAEEAERIF